MSLGQKYNFKNLFEGLINKSKGDSQKSFMDFLKSLGQKYRNTGKPIKIIDVYKEDGCFIFFLEDHSKWKIETTIKPPSWDWSRWDEIIVTGSRGGSGRMELYNIRNTSLEDEALCIFQGFMKE